MLNLEFLRGRSSSDVGALPAPWSAARSSLKSRIEAAAITAGEYGWIDVVEDEPVDESTVRWAPGAFEGIFGGAGKADGTDARRLVGALRALTRKPSPEAFRHFYDLLADAEVISLVDPFLTELAAASGLDRQAVAEVARRVACEAPDLAPVKMAVALLGRAGSADDAPLLQALGRYEELTLYAVVALSTVLDDPESAIWEVAKSTSGWGRIHAVRRLVGATSAPVRDWLLREGHRNGVMPEEIAYLCAVEGGLLDALSCDAPDDGLIDAAGDLIELLLDGGPAEDIFDYSDGAHVAKAYLRHVAGRQETGLHRFLTVQRLAEFNDDPENDWARLERNGWTAGVRWEVRTTAAAYLGRLKWRQIAAEGLAADDDQAFRLATLAAPRVGLDPWPAMLDRQRRCRSGEWYWLLQTQDEGRLQEVLALAADQLNLDTVGSGPTGTLGLGPGYEDDGAVDYILQALRRFPGCGWPFIAVGLRGRTVRARNMAVRALHDWGVDRWPEPAAEAVRQAIVREPDAGARARMERLLSGAPLD